MYNYSINTTYLTLDDDKQDTQYRKEYLSVFNLEKYDEDVIMNTVDTLYKTYKDNEQIKKLFSIGKENCIYSLNDEMTFILMFSFESFHYFHKCLKELERNNVISGETFDEIIKNLQKK